MVVRDRSVIVTLGKPVVRMEPGWCCIVTMRSIGIVVMMGVRRPHIMIVRMRAIRRERDFMDMRRRRIGLGVRMIGHPLDFNFQVMAVIEHGASEPVGRMVDPEDMLQPVEHNDRHLN
jgi:hypothetical protein